MTDQRPRGPGDAADDAAAAPMSVADRAIQTIRELIISGELGPGQRLPAEAELAQRLKVSRNSLREAVRALCAARVLEVRRGDGTYVSSLEPATLLGGLGFLSDLMTDNTVLELFEVRRLIEPQATGLAATRITDHDLAEITASLDKMRASTSVEELIGFDYEFHGRIMRVTGNETLCTLMDVLSSRALRARIWRGIDQGGVMSFTLEQHVRIVEALAARDTALAIAASTVHVSESERWLRRVISQQRPVQISGRGRPRDLAAARRQPDGIGPEQSDDVAAGDAAGPRG